MNEKMNKSDFLYMELTKWLIQNFGEVWDDYQLNTIEAHLKKWREYNE